MEYVSAGQIRLFSCPRRWAFAYGPTVSEAPKEDSPALIFGAEFHEFVEGYDAPPEHWSSDHKRRATKYRTTFQASRWADGALLEVPVSTISLEKRPEAVRSLPLEASICGIPIAGHVDVWTPGLGIMDHKTMGNLRSALTEEDLTEDIQMMLYAGIYLEHYPEARGLVLAHGQFSKKPRKVDGDGLLVTEAYVTREQVRAFWATNLVPKVRGMIELYDAGTEPNEFAVNTADCWNYGPCPFGPKGSGICNQGVISASWGHYKES